MEEAEKARENKIRRLARKQGFLVKKSRERYIYPYSATNCGKYMLTNSDGSFVHLGERYDASLDEIEEHILHEIQRVVNHMEYAKVAELRRTHFMYSDSKDYDFIMSHPQLKEIFDAEYCFALDYNAALDEIESKIKEIREAEGKNE